MERHVASSSITVYGRAAEAALLDNVVSRLATLHASSQTPVALCLDAELFAAARHRAGRQDQGLLRWVLVDTETLHDEEGSALRRACHAEGAIRCTSVAQAATLAALLSSLPVYFDHRLGLASAPSAPLEARLQHLPAPWRWVHTQNAGRDAGDLTLHEVGAPFRGVSARSAASPTLLVDCSALEPSPVAGSTETQVALDLHTLGLVLEALAHPGHAFQPPSTALATLPTTLHVRERPSHIVPPDADLTLLAAAIGWPVELRRTDGPEAWMARDARELEEATDALLDTSPVQSAFAWHVRKAIPESATHQRYRVSRSQVGGLWITRLDPMPMASWMMPLADLEASELPPATVVTLQRLAALLSPPPGQARTCSVWHEGATLWWEEETP